ncbi:hypothetical protein SAMN05442782_0316 [Streptomyces sp. OK228]|nr:hypothetical protein SAMN05442782_0316 [Streptomyces sp. OK228]
MTSPTPNMAPPLATAPEDSQPIFCPSAQAPAPATTKESQQAYDADQGMPPTRITGSPLHVPRTGPLRSGPCPFTARCPASTQPVTGLPDSDQERGGCGACVERSSLVYGLPKEPQSKGQQQPPARERAGMPRQASAAGHRVAARVRWVAMITAMHPASVTHPQATFRCCFSLTAVLPSRGVKPAIQISRPPGHSLHLTQPAPGPLDPFGCIPGLAELQAGQRGHEDRDGNAADRPGDGLVEPLFSVPEEAPHAISRDIKGR